MNYLLKEDIVLINKKTIEQHGGNFVSPHNFLHEDKLSYVIEAVDAKLFGVSLTQSIADKAGLYMFNIISNHIFQDGNKRTGLAAALLFLNLNNTQLEKELKIVTLEEKRIPEGGKTTQEVLYNFTMEIASGLLSLDECQLWFSENIR
jgi:death-on-curing protein